MDNHLSHDLHACSHQRGRAPRECSHPSGSETSARRRSGAADRRLRKEDEEGGEVREDAKGPHGRVARTASQHSDRSRVKQTRETAEQHPLIGKIQRETTGSTSVETASRHPTHLGEQGSRTMTESAQPEAGDRGRKQDTGDWVMQLEPGNRSEQLEAGNRSGRSSKRETAESGETRTHTRGVGHADLTDSFDSDPQFFDVVQPSRV